MKKQIKKIVAAMLMLAVMLTCVPTTAYAKEPFKWETSLTLKGKQFMTREGIGWYDFLVYFDRDTYVTVQNYNGFCDLAESIKKNAKTKSKTKCKAGFNIITLITCEGVKYKAGAEYKCKVTAKDANMVLLGEWREDNSVYSDNQLWFIDWKTEHNFRRWVEPQQASLDNYLAGTHGSYMSKLLVNAGIIKKSEQSKQAKKIDKYVGDAVQKSKMKGDKIIDHDDALLLYVDSVDGLEEKLKSIKDEKHSKQYGEELTYWDTFMNDRF